MAWKTFRPPTKVKMESGNVSHTTSTVSGQIKKRDKNSAIDCKKDQAKKELTKKVANKKFKEKKVYSYFPGLANDLKVSTKMNNQNVSKQTPQTITESLMANSQLTISVVPTVQLDTSAATTTPQNKSAIPTVKGPVVPSGIGNNSKVTIHTQKSVVPVSYPELKISVVPHPKQNMTAVPGSKNDMSVVQGPAAQNISFAPSPTQNMYVEPLHKKNISEVSVPLQNIDKQPILKQNISPESSSYEHLEPKVLKPGRNDCGDCEGCNHPYNCEKCRFCLKPSLKKKCQLRTCIRKVKNLNILPKPEMFHGDLTLGGPSPPKIPPIPLKSLPALSKLQMSKPVINRPNSTHHPKPGLSSSSSKATSQRGLSAISKPDRKSSSPVIKLRQNSSKSSNPRQQSSSLIGTNKSHQIHLENSVNEKLFSCQKCGKSFVFPKWLLNHIKKDCCRKVIKLKCCPICNKPIKSNYFNNHMKIHSTRMIKCDECNCSFKSESTLAAHKRGVHVHRPNVLVKCSECTKVFSNDRVLKQHITKSHGEKNLSCDMCKAMFTTTNGLRKHKLNHDAIADLIEKKKEQDSEHDEDEEKESQHDEDHGDDSANDEEESEHEFTESDSQDFD